MKWQIWVYVFTTGILVLALFGFAGYFTSVTWLSSFGETYIPMAPFTASSFLMLALPLYWLSENKMKRWKIMATLLLALILIILVLFSLADTFFLKSLNIEDYLITKNEIVNAVPLFRMSPAAKILFALAGFDLVLFTVYKGFGYKTKLTEYFGGIITIVVLIGSYIFCVSYLYGKPLLYNILGAVPLAISTALGFVLFALCMLIIKHELFPVRLLIAKTTHGILLRFIFPLVLIPVVLIQVALLFAFENVSPEPFFITTSLNLIIALIAGWLAVYISKYLSEIIDIQDSKINESEEILKQSEEKFRNLFETMLQGVVYQDADGNIIDANPSACTILGLTKDQLMGRSSFDLNWKAVDKNGNDLTGEQHPAMVALRTGSEVTNFLMGVFNPVIKQFVWILVNAIPRINQNSLKPTMVYATFLDITALKKANDENKVLQDSLEMQVELKTRELNVKITELESFYQATIDRELRMEELRQELEQYKNKSKNE